MSTERQNHKSFYEKALDAQRAGKWEAALGFLKMGTAEERTDHTAESIGLCMWWLGQCYEYGYWVVQNQSAAQKWYDLSAHACPRAMVEVIIRLWSEGQGNAAANELAQKILNGVDSYAKGQLYYGGWGVPYDFDKAVEYYASACEMLPYGDPFAQITLSKLYYHNGQIDQALFWCQKAADQGYCVAQSFLDHLMGHVIPTPIDSRVYWCRKAAEQNYAHAIIIMVDNFSGAGKYRNEAVAVYWYKKYTMIEPDTSAFPEVKDLIPKIEACKSACMTVVAIRKYKNSILNVLPRDVVVYIAKILWSTRESEEWTVDMHRCRCKCRCEHHEKSSN